MKNVFVVFFILLTIAVGFYFFFRYFAIKEVEYTEELKNNPIKFAYFLNDEENFISLVSSDTACMRKILTYYNKGNFQDHLPGCFEIGIPFNDTVYVIDSTQYEHYTKIAYFYTSPNGSQKYLLGYVMSNTLHKMPYSK